MASNNTIPEGFKPDLVFKIHHCMKNDLSFKTRTKGKGIFLAFHGSRIENFFSILKFGLQQHFSTEKVSKKYLNTEIIDFFFSGNHIRERNLFI